jgi:hypothetical protein
MGTWRIGAIFSHHQCSLSKEGKLEQVVSFEINGSTFIARLCPVVVDGGAFRTQSLDSP